MNEMFVGQTVLNIKHCMIPGYNDSAAELVPNRRVESVLNQRSRRSATYFEHFFSKISNFTKMHQNGAFLKCILCPA